MLLIKYLETKYMYVAGSYLDYNGLIKFVHVVNTWHPQFDFAHLPHLTTTSSAFYCIQVDSSTLINSLTQQTISYQTLSSLFSTTTRFNSIQRHVRDRRATLCASSVATLNSSELISVRDDTAQRMNAPMPCWFVTGWPRLLSSNDAVTRFSRPRHHSFEWK